jgi:hypothetical protein
MKERVFHRSSAPVADLAPLGNFGLIWSDLPGFTWTDLLALIETMELSINAFPSRRCSTAELDHRLAQMGSRGEVRRMEVQSASG